MKPAISSIINKNNEDLIFEIKEHLKSIIIETCSDCEYTSIHYLQKELLKRIK